MAAQVWSAAEQSNAQRVYLTKVYEGYQNATDVLGEFESVAVDPINYKGLQVPFEVSPNPSLGFGTGEGGAFPTAGASNMDNFVVTYVAMFNGLNQTYAALLNNNKETSEDMFRFEVKSNAEQFASWLNTYASAGDSTQALATISTSYAGGTPTIAVCNGTTDSIGVSNLVIGGYYTFWNAAGTTQRNGTVGAGPFQLTGKSATTATFGSNLPSDFVSTDIICPEVGTTDASYGLYGLPFINDAAGTYFGKARATYGGLSAYEKTSAGTLTAGMLSETYFSIVQRGGYFSNGRSNLLPALEMWTNVGNAQSYNSLALSSGAVVGGIHSLQHVGGKRPDVDYGGADINFTWFGAPLKVGNKLPGDQIFFQNMKMMRKAVLKQAGSIAQGMPASDYLQGVNADGLYTTNRLKFMDFWGQFYSPQPFKLGKISGLTLVAPTQKATNVLSA